MKLPAKLSRGEAITAAKINEIIDALIAQRLVPSSEIAPTTNGGGTSLALVNPNPLKPVEPDEKTITSELATQEQYDEFDGAPVLQVMGSNAAESYQVFQKKADGSFVFDWVRAH